ncbi:MAG: alpha-amylase family glycosyl hydrolase [Myxococcales bacterium]
MIASLLVLACAAPKPASVTQPPAAPGSSRELQTWANGAVFYEVFVRSFQDSDGDGKGDLKGLISRLDYLRDLGVDALWLMPVFASPSYHGYDTADYETINPDYGTNADFARLLEEAHRRGLRVVVDLVLNHTSSQHPWFVESASSSASARREWYVWRPDDPGWGQPWNPSGKTWHFKNGAYYYGLFWAGMPDLNFRTDAVRAEGKRIGALWLSRGVDGFRLDAVRHLIETGPGEHGQNDTEESHAYWKEFAAAMRAAKPDAALIGEAWTETPIIARYYGDTSRVPGGDELPLNFDFPLAGRIIAGVRSGDARPIAAKLKEIRETYPEGATDVPFLTNHDQARVASELAGDFAKLRSAAAVLLTLPGTPFLYYGEEVGLANGPGDGDEPKRTPMPWDDSAGGGFTTGTPWYRFSKGRETANVASQTRKPDSLLSAYRALLRARHASPALARGSLEVLQENGPVLAFLRTLGDERVLVAHNLSPEPQRVSLAVRATRLEPLYGDPGVEVRPGDAVRCALLPHASALLRVR